MSERESADVAVCIRCRQPLPAGSRFCVSCGCHHDSDLLQTRAAMESEMARRKNRSALWRRFFLFSWVFRRL